ncbi:MAG: hypothetical protein JKY61_05345 [Planctomycetes bacterium]|nr:hypothetical protein [Planctomycetota bacterium]
MTRFRILKPLYAFVLGLSIGACSSTQAIQQVSIPIGVPGQRISNFYLGTAKAEVTGHLNGKSPANHWDLKVDARSFAERVRFQCNGTRNIILVGNGQESQFRLLATDPAAWFPRDLGSSADAAGVKAPDRSRDYWTPAQQNCVKGAILAIRGPYSEDRSKSPIGALVFVKSVNDGTGNLEILIAKQR